MTTYIIEKFILSSRKNDNDNFRQRFGYVASIVGIISNGILSFVKILCGLLFGSISILGDGVNNLSDSASSIVTLIGFKIAEKPADKEHPFGHARMEYISGLIVAFIIMYISIELFISSIDKIINPSSIEVSPLIVVILIVSIIVKMWLYSFNKEVSDRIQSKTILGVAKDSLNDVIITAGVLTSIVIYHFFNWNLDGFVGVLLSILILKSGIDIAKDTLSPLLGEAPDEAFIREINDKLLSYEYVLGIHDLIVHNYGHNRTFLSVHLEFDSEFNLILCHEIADKIERNFEKENLNIVIHIDPVTLNDEVTDHYKYLVEDVITSIDNRISMHDFRLVQADNIHNLIFDIALPCEVSLEVDEVKNIITKNILAIDPSCKTIIRVDKHYNLNRI